MSIFPVITKEKQKMYEDFCWMNNPISIPCICGYCGRACRQMGAKADTASCMGCGLSVFVSVVEAIKKRCDEKRQTGIENLHDFDIFGIQEELKKKGVKAGTDYIKLILEYLIKEDNKMEYFDVVNEKKEVEIRTHSLDSMIPLVLDTLTRVRMFSVQLRENFRKNLEL